MAAPEIGEARDQPVRGEGGQYADGQGAGGAGAQFGDAAGDAVQGVAHRAGKLAPMLGQCHAAAAAFEQRHAEFALKCLHLMADCAMGDVQFGAGTAEVEVPRGGFECAQGVQRGQARGHTM
jgi:hypothetical protein